ncbi:MAG: hypothetical protein GY811_06305 [Myxococcales bacterium]|nr:hypothetical protein [Myxococcales bacterium]
MSRFAYAKGTVSATETKLIRLRENGEVLFFDGCALRRGKVGKNSSKALSSKFCGALTLASQDASRWFARRTNDEQVSVHVIDLESGDERKVLGGSGEASGLSLLKVYPSGKYLCFSWHRDGSELTCRDIDSAVTTDLQIWKGPTDRRAVFAANDTLGFGAGVLQTERDFFVVDLEARELRKLGALGPKEKWISAVGTEGFVAGGGKRLLHFDVAGNARVDIALGKGEWEGFAAIPGTTKEFIVGKERGATRDLFRVQLP